MRKVVLVDDEQIILNGLMRVIPWRDYGCEVAGTAGDGLDGLALIREVKPDILLTDIRMPNMDGLAMIAAIKSEFPALQISILTAFRDFDYAQQAMHLGVTRYLLKPSKMDELKEAIQTMAAHCEGPAPDPNPDPSPTASNYVVQAAMDYIQAHFHEHIRLSDVADSVYVSQWHLSKLLNKHTNQSFADILLGLRINRAKELLTDPHLRIHEIAEKAGFSDAAHFSRSFKRAAGMSPLEYRQNR